MVKFCSAVKNSILTERLPVLKGRRLGTGWRIAIGAAIGLACLALALWGAHWAEVGIALAQADYRLVALALVTVLLVTGGKARRWQLLCSSRPPIGLPRLLGIMLVGQLFNIALPVRLGDLARAYLVGRLAGESKAWALGTIVVEKGIDSIMLCLALGAVVPFALTPQRLRGATLDTLGTAAVIIGLILVSLAARRWWPVLARRGSIPLPLLLQRGLGDSLAALVSGFAALGHWPTHLWVWLWSLVIWALSASTIYLLFLAFGLSLPLMAAWVLLLALQVSMPISSSPGLVGVVHYACILVLVAFAVGHEQALAYGIVLHLVIVTPIVLLGTMALWRYWGILSGWNPQLPVLTNGPGKPSPAAESQTTS
jgi:uncharacterized membrane protein YbhN (UPF0104 family)